MPVATLRTPGAAARRRINASHVTTKMGWHRYFVQQYNLLGHEGTAILAMWYLFMALRDGEIE